LVPAAVRALGDITKDKRHRDRARAAVAILDRYYGTPTQTITGDLTITHALAEIEARIIEHDPSWIPSAKLKDAPDETVNSAGQPPAGENRPDDERTDNGAESEHEATESGPTRE
jgi:hypothetical protein